MRSTHYITITAGVVVIAIMYFFGNTIPPEKKAEGMPNSSQPQRPGGMTRVKSLPFDSILSNSKLQLTKGKAEELKTIENELLTIHDSTGMVSSFLHIGEFWKATGDTKISAYYNGLAAKLENSEKKLTFAARIFLELMQQENIQAVQMWEAEQAVNLAESSFKLDSGNEDTKLALATGYIEGVGEPMKGVQILLGIVRQKPDDIPANLLLGQMSVQSGQFDKAIGRFETVLKQDSLNKEAIYYLAEAYKGKGEKKKAIELLEKCKLIVNDKEFSNKADQEINSLK